MIEFFSQYPVFVPFIAILTAEMLKALIDIAQKRKKVRLISPGGMPSGHSAFVASAVVLVAMRDGFSSTLFAVIAVLALLVMYDAVNLRYEAGRHAHLLNRLLQKPELNESLGHTHLQVIAGALWGGGISFLLLSMG